jgi:hypothetical protein
VRSLIFAGTLLVMAAGAPTQRYMDMDSAQVDAALAEARKITTVQERLTAVTAPLLGTPYVLGNLGEGPEADGRDTDPRFNLRAMDCTTFVEHALAFAGSSSQAEAQRRLDHIRYVHGKVGYGTRRHWPEAQWVPGLVEEGYLRDVTRDVAGKKAAVETTSVTPGGGRVQEQRARRGHAADGCRDTPRHLHRALRGAQRCVGHPGQAAQWPGGEHCENAASGPAGPHQPPGAGGEKKGKTCSSGTPAARVPRR